MYGTHIAGHFAALLCSVNYTFCFLKAFLKSRSTKLYFGVASKIVLTLVKCIYSAAIMALLENSMNGKYYI